LKQKAILVLEDGSSFEGFSCGGSGYTVGEVVFNTSITGYQEILTDPSYANQIVLLTHPHIGNTGINELDLESRGCMVSGLIVRDFTDHYSNWRASGSLAKFLIDNKIVAISEIDTRKITRIIREKGALRGCIMTDNSDFNLALKLARDAQKLDGLDLAKKVTTRQVYSWEKGNEYKGFGRLATEPKKNFEIIVYDFGVKQNILRILVDIGCAVTVVPCDFPTEKVIELSPDGVFFSNGPGDPEPCDYAIKNIKILANKNFPIFGICLGFQLIALAFGANTKKMMVGHHGANHPVKEVSTGKVFISSQNHGFTVDENSLSKSLIATHFSIFDGSLQGIEHVSKPIFGFQGHPEASPGPNDLNRLFGKFLKSMEDRKK
tara:strand:+ start:247 stop:1377 length:1131 start_codon:yes stop_codon:yes gene_type:complete